MRLFLDVHDRKNKTFPSQISRDEFEAFLGAFAKSCDKEGVAIVRSHVNLGCGRAFCLTMAKDEEAVRRAHAEVDLNCLLCQRVRFPARLNKVNVQLRSVPPCQKSFHSSFLCAAQEI